MVQMWGDSGRSGTRFALKTIDSVWVAGEFRRQEFERNKAAELGVLGLVDYAHAAPAELFDDPVVRDGLADHKVRILRG